MRAIYVSCSLAFLLGGLLGLLGCDPPVTHVEDEGVSPPCSCAWFWEAILSRRDPLATWDEIVVPEDLVFVDEGPGTGVDGRYGPEIREPSREEHFDSDWERQLEQMAEAGEGSDGQDLAETAKLNELQREAQKAKAPHRNINPESWDCGVTGQRIVLPGPINDTSSGQVIQLLDWQGSDAETCPVTVTIAPETLPTSTNLFPVATVRWGSRGTQLVADVDIGTGVQFVIAASSVQVSAYLDVGSTANNLWINGSLGFYAASQSQPVYRTIATPTGLLSGTPQTITRPNFARTIYGVERNNSGIEITLTFLTAAGATVYQRVIPSGNYVTTPIPLTPNVRSVRLSQTSGTDLQAVYVIFGLF